MKHIFICSSFMLLFFFNIEADSWIYKKEKKVEKHKFGDIEIVLTTDSTKNQSWPDHIIDIYKNDKLVSKFKNISFGEIFNSKNNKYFLGVSNWGIPGTAYVIFDNQGNLIKEVKHKFSRLKYTNKSITMIRTWYNKNNPNVKFILDGDFLEKILINSSNGDEINLIKHFYHDKYLCNVDYHKLLEKRYQKEKNSGK